MERRRCIGTNKAGLPCGAQPIRDELFCLKHHPDLINENAEWIRAGGKGKSNASRAAKRLPADLQDTLQTLYRALAALESGEMEPARASAMASICRAIVSVFEMGDAERRIQEIEQMLKEKSA
jgi:hypothetical protein